MSTIELSKSNVSFFSVYSWRAVWRRISLGSPPHQGETILRLVVSLSFSISFVNLFFLCKSTMLLNVLHVTMAAAGTLLGAVSTKSVFFKRRSAPWTAFNAFVRAAQKRRTECFSFTSLIRVIACIHRYAASICWLHHLASDTWTSSLVAPTILLENECKINSASCRGSGGCGRSPCACRGCPEESVGPQH